MVHVVPDSAGKVTVPRTRNKTGYFIVNLSITNTVTIAPEGETSIPLLPGAYLSVPDKIGFVVTGGNSDRNFLVMRWEVGREA